MVSSGRSRFALNHAREHFGRTPPRWCRPTSRQVLLCLRTTRFSVRSLRTRSVRYVSSEGGFADRRSRGCPEYPRSARTLEKEAHRLRGPNTVSTSPRPDRAFQLRVEKVSRTKSCLGGLRELSRSRG